MKRLFTLLFAAMLAGQAWAETTFTKNNLEYTVTDATNHYVSVGKAGTKPTGDLEIKDTVSYEGVIYTVTSIPSSGFYGCNKLTSITLPSTITSIGFESFYNCNQLTAFTIPSAVTSIGKYAFRACSNLTSINIPSGVSSIGDNAFESCSGLTAFNVESDNATYCSIDGVLFKKKNTYLSLICYPSSKADTEYNLPDNVSSIENKAFYGCKFLASINVSNSNKDFYSDNGVLLDINKRTLIVYPSQKADTAYSIPNTVVIILYKAFYQCQNIKSLIIPKSVTDIDEYSIHNCTNLTVKCCAASKPEGWLEKWSYNVADVVWGYTPEETPGTKTWTVSLSANNSSYGSVSGGGTVKDGETTTITATPAEGYRFVKWSNGLTNATETITVTSDLTLVAEFEKTASSETWTVTLSANNSSYGSVSDGGTVKDGSTITITATPAKGYYFVKWSNGLTTPTATITVTSDLNLEAIFAEKNVFFAGGLKYEITSDTTVQVVKSDDYKDLKKVVIPETVEIGGKTYTVTNIGYEAFENCEQLNSFSLPKSINSFDSYVLYGCSSLTEIKVDEENPAYSSVDGVLFNKDKTELICCPSGKSDSYTIPNTVTDIHYGAFRNCSKLTSIDIPNSVKHIDNVAFYGCSSLKEITIPEGITTIEMQTFVDCSSLSSVTIPQSVTEINNNSFEDCKSLKSITIPSSVTYIGNSAFRGCYNLTDMNLDGNKYYTFENQTLFNKDKTVLLKYLNSKATEYTIPNTVKRIDDDAFHGCSIASITIPESVTSIGTWAFLRCWNLTSVTIPNSVTDIDGHAFEDCYYLESVILSESVKRIGNNFTGCDNFVFNEFGNACYVGTADNPYYALIKVKSNDITTCEIHNNCKVIAKWAFDNCDNLQYNEYDSVLYLGNTDNPYLMLIKAKSTDIESCKIGDGCRFIDNSAFMNCKKLKSITIPNGVTNIGENAFYSCEKLATINIPESVRSIGQYAFYNCESLTSITIPDGVTAIENSAFYNCRSLASVTIPNSITSIGNWAFSHCPMTEINISESVTKIGEGALYDCDKLNQIKIPNSVTNIGERAFSGCDNLTIFCEAESKPEGWDEEWNSSGRPVIWGFDPSTKIFNVALSANSEWRGTVKGSGLAVEGSKVTITATPKEGYHFVKWSNGLTTDTATITVTSDTTLVAEFAEDKYWTVTLSANIEHGRVDKISGSNLDGSIFTAYASPFPGYKFVKWSNGLTTDTISITLTSDTTLTAEFAEKVYAGTCGDDARWSFNVSSKTLTISGTGSIDRYKTVDLFSTEVNRPWQEVADQIEKVVIGEGITNLGSHAFSYCNNLEEVNISSTCDSYGSMSFANCPNLKKMVVAANSVYQANEYCFSNYETCTVYVPAGRVDYYKKDIIFGMFSNIVGGYTVTIDDEIKNGTVEVESYIVPEGGTVTVTPIPDEGYSIAKIIDVKFEDENGYYSYSVNTNGHEYWIEGVISNIVVKVNFSREGDSESGFTYKIISGNNIEITGYKGTGGFVEIPSTVTDNGVEYTVTRIGESAFYNNVDIESITIPSTVTSIGSGAFAYLYLTSLTIPNSVTEIGEGAFYTIKNIVYKGNATGSPWEALTVNGYIDGNCIFADAEKTHLTAYINPSDTIETTIYIPESVITIGENAFINVWAKKIDDGYYFGNDENPYLILWHVGDFMGDSEITSYEIHDGCKYIYYTAFANMENLESVTIPNSVVSIGKLAFYGCRNLKSVNIPDGVLNISEGAFSNCYELTSITIPKSVTTIDKYAFENCHNLKITCEVSSKPAGWDNEWSDATVTWAKTDVAIAESAANAVNIYAYGNKIVVENATEEIRVYNAMGALVGCVGKDAPWHVSTETTTITIKTSGVYIVKTGATVKRVMVK